MPAKKATAVSKPTYAIMVHESIKSIGDRTGSSVQAITKQLQAQYNIEINKPALIKAIKKGVENGDLVQIKASYKLGKKTSTAKPKKTTTTTVVAKKKAPVKPKTTSRSRAATTKPRKTITKRTKSTTTRRAAAITKKAATKKTTAKRSTTTKKKSAKNCPKVLGKAAIAFEEIKVYNVEN